VNPNLDPGEVLEALYDCLEEIRDESPWPLAEGLGFKLDDLRGAIGRYIKLLDGADSGGPA
jgi:hypothetical protein